VSGYELDYEPELWNNPYDGIINPLPSDTELALMSIQSKTNCYMYALNIQLELNGDDNEISLDKRSPGYYSGDEMSSSETTTSLIYSFIEADEEALKEMGYDYYSISTIDATTKCPDGAYKVALFINPGNDYHWYRQNPDGIWSHKVDDKPVRDIDASGNVIWDPRTADRDYTNAGGVNYPTFVDFFSVVSLDEMYIFEE